MSKAKKAQVEDTDEEDAAVKGKEMQVEEMDEKKKGKDELLAQMRKAVDDGDWKAVSKISTEIAKVVAAEERSEKEARQSLLAQQTVIFTDAIRKVVDSVVAEVPDNVIGLMDGVWFSFDFGESLAACRLTKTAPHKASSGGGGAGKKYSAKTSELLEKYGDTKAANGDTYRQLYDATTDGNQRYNIRVKLLKLAGVA